jgi:LysM repeat protein
MVAILFSRRLVLWALWGTSAAVASGQVAAQGAGSLPVTGQQRDTAQQVAQAGVPLSDLAPNAPDSHTVQRGDTLWDISKLFLKSPWRWPELWGMNLDQIRNPHLIYPGQVLVLDKSGGRARLRVADAAGGAPSNTVKLSPRVRSQVLDNGAIASIPLQLIGPFLNQAVVFNGPELQSAPRIVATQEGRVMLSRGELAYVRGDLGGARDFRIFREPRAILDPLTREVLGYEARYVGAAEFTRAGGTQDGADGKPVVVPDTFTIRDSVSEATIGDRLSPRPQSDLSAFVPRAPGGKVEARVASVYGDAVTAGQNQVVAISKGSQDGVERGHVLALWRAGDARIDRTDPNRARLQLPDERHGLAFVFRVFDRVSYVLILQVNEPVRIGDRLTQP